MCIFCIMNIIICHVLFDSALNKRGLLAGGPQSSLSFGFSLAVRWRCLPLSGIVVLCLLWAAVETTEMSGGRSEGPGARSARSGRTSHGQRSSYNAGCKPNVKS